MSGDLDEWKKFQKKLGPTVKTRACGIGFIHWRMTIKGLVCIGFGDEFRGDLDHAVPEADLIKKVQAEEEYLRYQDLADKTYLLHFESIPGEKTKLKATLTRQNDGQSHDVTVDLDVMLKNNQLANFHVWSKNIDPIFDEMGKLGAKHGGADKAKGAK